MFRRSAEKCLVRADEEAVRHARYVVGHGTMQGLSSGLLQILFGHARRRVHQELEHLFDSPGPLLAFGDDHVRLINATAENGLKRRRCAGHFL